MELLTCLLRAMPFFLSLLSDMAWRFSLFRIAVVGARSISMLDGGVG